MDLQGHSWLPGRLSGRRTEAITHLNDLDAEERDPETLQIFFAFINLSELCELKTETERQLEMEIYSAMG
jgi:hypothetical protein